MTCYDYEPWHFRYLGRELAAQIHASGLTTREYLWAQLHDDGRAGVTPRPTATPTAGRRQTPPPIPPSTATPRARRRADAPPTAPPRDPRRRPAARRVARDPPPTPAPCAEPAAAVGDAADSAGRLEPGRSRRRAWRSGPRSWEGLVLRRGRSGVGL